MVQSIKVLSYEWTGSEMRLDIIVMHLPSVIIHDMYTQDKERAK